MQNTFNHPPFQKLGTFLSLSVIVAATAGCATTIESIPITAQTAQPIRGMAYSLPKAQVKLTVVRKLGTEEDIAKAQKALTAAEETIKSAQLGRDKAETVSAELTKQVAAAKGDGKTKLETRLQISEAKFLVFDSELKAAKADQVAAKITLEAKKNDKGKLIEEITIVPLAVVADRENTFVANLNHLMTRDDSMQLSVENGLLSSTGKAIADDKTADILVSLANIIGAKNAPTKFNTFFRTNTPPLNEAKPTQTKSDCELKTASFIFDPTNKKETSAVVESLNSNLKFSFAIDFGGDGLIHSTNSVLDSVFKLEEEVKVATSSTPIPGLAYRPIRDLRITVKPTQGKDNCKIFETQPAESFVISVPDASRIAYLPMDSGALNSNTTTFTFDKGNPKEFSTSRASEIAALLKIPVNVAKALISVPTEFIKLRIDYSSEDTKLLKAQIDRLQAAQDLKDKIKGLADKDDE
jgi:hypothetical protein